MSIKKIKIASVWVDVKDKEIIAKATGKKYNVCNASIKVSDDCKHYAGKSIKMGFFANEEKKRSGKDQAEYFKGQNEGKEILLDVTEEEWEKDDKSGTSLKGKTLSKAKKEAYEEILKEMSNK
jgi:hypothetical protein